MDTKGISVAITTHNEGSRGNFQWIREAIVGPLISKHVREVVITDDNSEDFEALLAYTSVPGDEKLRLIQIQPQHGVFGAKVESVLNCTSEWVQLCDSDNVMDAAFFERLSYATNNPSVFTCPSFARPSFDYRHLAGRYGLADIPQLANRLRFDCAMNTGNQLVNRQAFKAIFERYRGPRFDLLQPDYLNLEANHPDRRAIYDSADSFIINSLWLRSGGKLEFVPGLEYQHRVHGNSSWDKAPKMKDKLPGKLLEELLLAAEKIA